MILLLILYHIFLEDLGGDTSLVELLFGTKHLE